MRDKILKTLARWHANHPGRMLILILLITMILGFFARHLSVTMRWSDLLPAKDPRTIQYNKIIDEFVSATSIIIVVQGEEHRIKAFADSLAPKLLKAHLERDGDSVALIRRVDYKTEIDFLRHHGLMLIKEDDVKNMKEVFTDPNLSGLLFNLNNAMEKEYVGQTESLSTRQKEDQAVMFLDGIESLAALLTRTANGESIIEEDARRVVDKLLMGEPYFLSYDKEALILNAIPNFSVMDIDLCVDGTAAIQRILDDVLKEFPGVKAGLTGFIPVCHDEMVYSQKSLGYTSLIAVIAILILLIVSFRMWLAPLYAILNLIIGIVWAVEIVTLLVGQLNIMTQMMAVILLGLGIDFSIHLISAFTEYRAQGRSILEALEQTFLKTGRGVITGALTTACAFLTMVISESRGMKEMGLVTGAGILAILIATFLVLPVFIVFRERWWEKKAIQKQVTLPQRDLSFRFLGSAGSWFSRRWNYSLALALLLTAFFVWMGSQISFDQNYMNIEPEGLTSVTLQDTVVDKFDLDMNYALILTDNPEESQELSKRYRELGSVAMVEDIGIYLPPQDQQEKRRPYVTEIYRKMKSAVMRSRITPAHYATIQSEIDRLRMNVIEMQDMAYLGGHDKVDNKCRSIVGDPEKSDSGDKMLALIGLLKSPR
ncbi:MAG: MMPL family transporter, partial [bacterium]